MNQKDFSHAAIAVRPVKETEVSQLFSLINELAEFEKLSHWAVGDKTLLQQALFAQHAKIHALLATDAEETVGFALYFFNFSTFLARPGLYLEDIYVRPAYRSKGIGSAFFIALAKIAKNNACGRMECSVLNWNTEAQKFYQRLGAESMSEWTLQRFSSAAFHQIAEHTLPEGITLHV